MKSYHAELTADVVGLIAVLLACSTALAPPARAQRANMPQPVSVDPAKIRRQETTVREIGLRNVGARPEDAKDQQHVQAVIDEIKQDYKRIQLVRSELAHVITTHQSLDLKQIAKEAEEINKRAHRLQSRLALYKAEADEQPNATQLVEFRDDQMQDALIKLCNLIMNFTTNPVFQTLTAVDVQESTRASRDLDGIILLSGHIKKSAARLSKPTK
jgi:desulfoferrodoxin (superoxide reductase-like protein)